LLVSILGIDGGMATRLVGGASESFSSFFWFSMQIVWMASAARPFSRRPRTEIE
jgi:hypothetical protein